MKWCCRTFLMGYIWTGKRWRVCVLYGDITNWFSAWFQTCHHQRKSIQRIANSAIHRWLGRPTINIRVNYRGFFLRITVFFGQSYQKHEQQRILVLNGNGIWYDNLSCKQPSLTCMFSSSAIFVSHFLGTAQERRNNTGEIISLFSILSRSSTSILNHRERHCDAQSVFPAHSPPHLVCKLANIRQRLGDQSTRRLNSLIVFPYHPDGVSPTEFNFIW